MPKIVNVTYSKADIEGLLQQLDENLSWGGAEVVRMTAEGVELVKKIAVYRTRVAEAIGKLDELGRKQVAEGKSVEIVAMNGERVKVQFEKPEEAAESEADDA